LPNSAVKALAAIITLLLLINLNALLSVSGNLRKNG